MKWLDPGECPPIDKKIALTQEQAEQFLRSRRSIRNFKDKAVERVKLEKLLEVACCAPSAKNNQPWFWTIVEERADVERYASMVIEWMRSVIEKFPEQAEMRGLPRVVAGWDSGEDRVCRGAPHIIVVHGDKDYGFGSEDGALALSYFELFAQTLGLGSCWAGYFYSAINAHRPLFDALGLPAGHRAFGAVMVGYPKLRYQRMPLRNRPNVSWK